MGEEERALALADRLLKDSPDDPELLHARGVALFDLGRLDEARSEVEAALVKAPEQPDLLLLLANILRKQGHQAEAEAMRTRADAAHAKRLEQLQKARPAPPPPRTGG
ncbi:tetratricopeptide repeat protein [Myxococcota bacterium]|nr:tetratricopeptide repeat protein [Myxococcota bacterium]